VQRDNALATAVIDNARTRVKWIIILCSFIEYKWWLKHFEKAQTLNDWARVIRDHILYYL